MNPDQQAALDRVPRFLDDLEPIERKKLTQENRRKERWSLSGKQGDSKVLAEMGVAPLTNEYSDEERISNIRKEDIENFSPNPNTGRSNKRTYHQAALSPLGSSNEKVNEDVSGAKKSRAIQDYDGCKSNTMLLNNNTDMKDVCSSEKTLSERKILQKSKSPLTRNVNHKEKIKNNVLETISEEENKSEILASNNNKEEIKPILGQTDDNDILNKDVDLNIESSENSRESADNNHDDLNTTKNIFVIHEDDSDGDSNNVSKSVNMYSTNTSVSANVEPHLKRCEENMCPLSTVDQAILDYAEEDLEQTMVHDKEDESEKYFQFVQEKECFTSQDQSFCTTDKCSTSSRCLSNDSKSVIEDDTDSMFSKLSDEVVLSILQWLPKRVLVRCMHVCKRWRRLAADGRLWARVDLGGRVLPSGALQTLMDRHPLVLRLANAQLTPPILLQACSNEWRIQYLDLSCATLLPECVTKIISNSPQLVKLSIEALTLDDSAHKALERLTQLRTLNASQVIGFSIDCCKSLSKMVKLEHLNVAWTRLDKESLSVLISSLNPGIVRLNLAGCRKTILDDAVVTLVGRLPKLMELDLSDAALITNTSVKAIIQLSALEHLAISRCYCLHLRDYILLSQCRGLLYVDAFGILPPLNIPLLNRHLPNIQFNKFMHSSIARPTVGNRRTSIWGLRTRD